MVALQPKCEGKNLLKTNPTRQLIKRGKMIALFLLQVMWRIGLRRGLPFAVDNTSNLMTQTPCLCCCKSCASVEANGT